MQLAYVVGCYPTPSETFIAREVEGLRHRSHSVDVYSLFVPSQPDDLVHYGWRSAIDRLRRRLNPEGAVCALGTRWRVDMVRHRPHVVVAHFGSLPSTVAFQAAGEIPVCLSLHARDLYVEAEHLEEKVAAAHAVITCTAANLQYLQERFPAYHSRLHLIYHGLPRPWLAAEPPVRRREPHAPLRLLAVGRLVEKKGFHVLLEACARLRQQGTAFSLGVVGDGPQRSALLRQARELGIAHAVSVTGWQTQEMLYAAYLEADVFCCPSIMARDGDRDGLPNVLVEAMSTGLPAVGSALSGIPEAIIDNETGFLVPPGDVEALATAIDQLCDPAVRQQLGIAAAAAVRARFAAEVWLKRLEILLRQCV
jgi:glycosyltransferase involved in cell wall biosynthesis